MCADITKEATASTRAVRAGIESDTQHGAVVPALHLSTNYSFTGLGGKRAYDYSRSGNPTRDLLGNALGNGVAGEYISTRAYLAAQQGRRWAIALQALLDWIQPGHCRASYEAELARVAALKAENAQP